MMHEYAVILTIERVRFIIDVMSYVEALDKWLDKSNPQAAQATINIAYGENAVPDSELELLGKILEAAKCRPIGLYVSALEAVTSEGKEFNPLHLGKTVFRQVHGSLIPAIV